ncbi:MAG TPA: hypothetical protein VJ927_10070 [Actinomycetota bacterium]|nr:hypothetical protein [Actinomycetota bacterium]
MRGAGAVLALVLIEWTAGWVALAAWSQSWKVVRRGHFRITGWIVAVLGVLAVITNLEATEPLGDAGIQPLLVAVLAGVAAAFAVAQYVQPDGPGVAAGLVAGLAGVGSLVASAPYIEGWAEAAAAASLLAGALLLGAVTNGMMLGHWYLNQPGLKTWALGRLTDVSVAAVALSAVAGLVAYEELTGASTEGAVLGIPGFGESFSFVFFFVWLSMLALTGAVAWGARRCVKIRSIQSATGLFYVAILSAGVAEFLVRYLMVNAA